MAGVLLLAIGLAIVLTWPVAPRLSRVGRLNTGDGHWSIWCVTWVAHALTTNPLGLFDANIFHPHRRTLAYSENNLVAGVLGLPAWILTRNALATHNTAMLAGFVLAFLAAYALARRLTGDTGAAIGGAIAFAYCPYVLAHTAHIQLMMTFGLPLALLALHRLVDAPSVGRGVALGAALAVQALACGYYGIFAVLIVGLGLLLFAATRGLWTNRRYGLGVAAAVVVSMASVAPFFAPYVSVQRELGFARTIADATMYSANWQAWLASSAIAHRWVLPLLRGWSEVLFPGAITVVLGVAGAAVLIRGSRPGAAAAAGVTPAPARDEVVFYALVGVLAFWISFGPPAGLYTLLFHTIPAFSLLRAPSRFAILVTLALSMLMAMGAARVLASWTGRRRTIASAGLAAAVALELAVVPLAMPEAGPVNNAYRVLAATTPGPVVELPFFHSRSDYPRHAAYMFNATRHWLPLVNGYSDHIPPDFRVIAEPLSTFPSMEAFRLLQARRVRYVVLHLDLYDQRLRRRVLDRLEAYREWLRPLSRENDVWLFEIVGWP